MNNTRHKVTMVQAVHNHMSKTGQHNLFSHCHPMMNNTHYNINTCSAFSQSYEHTHSNTTCVLHVYLLMNSTHYKINQFQLVHNQTDKHI